MVQFDQWNMVLFNFIIFVTYVNVISCYEELPNNTVTRDETTTNNLEIFTTENISPKEDNAESYSKENGTSSAPTPDNTFSSSKDFNYISNFGHYNENQDSYHEAEFVRESSSEIRSKTKDNPMLTLDTVSDRSSEFPYYGSNKHESMISFLTRQNQRIAATNAHRRNRDKDSDLSKGLKTFLLKNHGGTLPCTNQNDEDCSLPLNDDQKYKLTFIPMDTFKEIFNFYKDMEGSIKTESVGDHDSLLLKFINRKSDAKSDRRQENINDENSLTDKKDNYDFGLNTKKDNRHFTTGSQFKNTRSQRPGLNTKLPPIEENFQNNFRKNAPFEARSNFQRDFTNENDQRIKHFGPPKFKDVLKDKRNRNLFNTVLHQLADEKKRNLVLNKSNQRHQPVPDFQPENGNTNFNNKRTNFFEKIEPSFVIRQNFDSNDKGKKKTLAGLLSEFHGKRRDKSFTKSEPQNEQQDDIKSDKRERNKHNFESDFNFQSFFDRPASMQNNHNFDSAFSTKTPSAKENQNNGISIDKFSFDYDENFRSEDNRQSHDLAPIITNKETIKNRDPPPKNIFQQQLERFKEQDREYIAASRKPPNSHSNLFNNFTPKNINNLVHALPFDKNHASQVMLPDPFLITTQLPHQLANPQKSSLNSQKNLKVTNEIPFKKGKEEITLENGPFKKQFIPHIDVVRNPVHSFQKVQVPNILRNSNRQRQHHKFVQPPSSLVIPKNVQHFQQLSQHELPTAINKPSLSISTEHEQRNHPQLFQKTPLSNHVKIPQVPDGIRPPQTFQTFQQTKLHGDPGEPEVSLHTSHIFEDVTKNNFQHSLPLEPHNNPKFVSPILPMNFREIKENSPSIIDNFNVGQHKVLPDFHSSSPRKIPANPFRNSFTSNSLPSSETHFQIGHHLSLDDKDQNNFRSVSVGIENTNAHRVSLRPIDDNSKPVVNETPRRKKIRKLIRVKGRRKNRNRNNFILGATTPTPSPVPYRETDRVTVPPDFVRRRIQFSRKKSGQNIVAGNDSGKIEPSDNNSKPLIENISTTDFLIRTRARANKINELPVEPSISSYSDDLYIDDSSSTNNDFATELQNFTELFDINDFSFSTDSFSAIQPENSPFAREAIEQYQLLSPVQNSFLIGYTKEQPTVSNLQKSPFNIGPKRNFNNHIPLPHPAKHLSRFPKFVHELHTNRQDINSVNNISSDLLKKSSNREDTNATLSLFIPSSKASNKYFKPYFSESSGSTPFVSTAVTIRQPGVQLPELQKQPPLRIVKPFSNFGFPTIPHALIVPIIPR